MSIDMDVPKMDYEEMIDTLKGLVFGTFDRTTAKEREALDMAISALSAKEPKNGERFSCPNCGFKADWFIPSDREKGEWIPTTERLPKCAGVYRVTRYYPNNVMNPTYLVDACFFDGSNTWHNDNRINHDRAYVDNVIAWQEDPEPFMRGKAK